MLNIFFRYCTDSLGSIRVQRSVGLKSFASSSKNTLISITEKLT